MEAALATKLNIAQANSILIAELEVNYCKLLYTQEHCRRRREWVRAVPVNETDEWSVFVIIEYLEA